MPRSLSDLALNALRSNIGTLELDQLLSERQRLNEIIAAQLTEVSEKWGVLLTRVEIQEISTTDETAAAMRQQMEAERRKRALIAEAEGKAEAEIKVAEAERQAMILRAEGQAKALTTIAEAERDYLKRLEEAVEPSQAYQVLVAQKYLDGFDKISENPSDKVFLPNSFQGVFAVPTDGGEKSTK